MNEADVRRRVIALTKESTESAIAARLKISPQYLNDFLRGRRAPGKKLLDALQLKRVITYTDKREGGGT